MRLVVGLGNPGPKYAGTRHNVGFDVLAELASRYGAPRGSLKFEGELVEVMIGPERTLLLAPQTYMNLSGRSVRAAVNFYKLPLEHLLVISDDLNLPTAQLRLRGSGSSGGQKGLQNTIDQLGTDKFARLRIGIDRPRPGFPATDYVLQRFSKAEREKMEIAVAAAADGVEVWVREGLEAAMNRVNVRESRDT